MLIGGLQKTSLIDYPDKVSAIVFTVGCNFRCGYCYNPELVQISKGIQKFACLKQNEFFKFLNKRKKILDAVVITGGEPTIYKDLPKFVKKIKEIGYLIKLDTNGTNPKMLNELIKNKLINYIAMDIKAPLHKYEKVVNIKVNTDNIKKSINIIMNSGLPYEFRSTILPYLHTEKDLIAMSKMIKGAKKYFLQKFITVKKMNNPKFMKLEGFTDKEMKRLAKICRKWVKTCKFRG